ncbi:hypothetical protein ACOK4R_33995 (plasmid) [Pseudomonas fluorescens]|uniref:hypothetical protein n=1 Tax=Pseudomonas TaxID=286 RepID=UPI001F12A96C|nr:MULTISPECIES: hypothetical protein [Pseudomonas]
MQLLGHLSASLDPESSDSDPLRVTYRQVSKLPKWQMLVLAFEDGFKHVDLRNHQRDKSVRADFLADEVLFRFTNKILSSPGALDLFRDAEQLTIQMDKLHRNLNSSLEQVDSFPAGATHPHKFLEAASFMLAQTRGMLGMKDSVKSGTRQVRALLYPEPVKTTPSALDRFFMSQADDGAERERESIKAFSEPTLSVKVLQMVSGNELARPGHLVYGTATLKVYLPMMLNALIEGIPHSLEQASLLEYVESSRNLVGHLQRCQRQVDLLTASDPQP